MDLKKQVKAIDMHIAQTHSIRSVSIRVTVTFKGCVRQKERSVNVNVAQKSEVYKSEVFLLLVTIVVGHKNKSISRVPVVCNDSR